MDWLNLHIPTVLRSPEFIGEDPTNQATWLKLSAFCAALENGGRITKCSGWKCRKWQQLCGVTKAETNLESGLIRWDGEDLTVAFYPVEKEQEVKMKREIAKENGRKSGGRPSRPEITDVETNVGFQTEPTSAKSPKAEGEGERKDKGKGSCSDLENSPSEQARKLCQAHPKRAETSSALDAALYALRKHPFEKILEGTMAYADAVAAWTPAERLQFVKNPEAFFREDIWNQPAENWGSRIKARQAAAVVNLEEARKSLGRRAAHIS